MMTTGRLSGRLKPIQQRNALLLKWWSESKLMLLPTELNLLMTWWEKQAQPDECLGRFLTRHQVLDPIVLEALDLFSGGAAPPAPRQLFAGKGLVTLRQLLHQFNLASLHEQTGADAPYRANIGSTEVVVQSATSTLDAKQGQSLQRELEKQSDTGPRPHTPVLEGIQITSSCPTPLTVRLPPEVGQRLGKCQLVERIGEGAFGIVFRARHLSLDTDVAVKVLNLSRVRDRGPRRRRFQGEAKLLARVDHPHLVRILDYEDDEQFPYLILEFVHGESLAEVLKQRGKFPLGAAVTLILQTAHALAAAHNAGVVHRDVKPGNILVTADGQAKLTDLGMATLLDPELRCSLDESVCGTVSYMAPEQFHRPHVDCRSDIYALGCTFFQTLTGRVPYSGDTPFEVMMQHVQEQIPAASALEPSVPVPLSDLILRMMAKFPENRFQTYEEFLAILDVVARYPTPTPSGRRNLFGWLGWGKKS